MAKQRTLARPATCRGVGLHTGHDTVMTFRPAPPDTGFAFRRVDLPDAPLVPADVEHVVSTDRGTTLAVGDVTIHTVEHVLAALYALEVDNCVIELDAPEPPVLDGSAQEFARALAAAGFVEQDAPRRECIITDPVALSFGDVSMTVMPADELRLSYTIAYGHAALGSQFASLVITPEQFLTEVAPARTFCFLQDVEALQANGLIRGGSLDNAVVIGDDAILNDELRFADEFVRHKILDLLGDLALLGPRLRGHVTATKAGHGAHVAFLRYLRDRTGLGGSNGQGAALAPADDRGLRPAIGLEAAQQFLPFDREGIKRIIPHGEPFLFLDDITVLREDLVVGTYLLREDEWFFRGHFPGMPVTPGVVMVEALAQVGGVYTRLVLPEPDNIPVLLMLGDVKFRTAVRPGDELRLEVIPVRVGRRIGRLTGKAYVGDALVCECTVVFGMVPASRVRDMAGVES